MRVPVFLSFLGIKNALSIIYIGSQRAYNIYETMTITGFKGGMYQCLLITVQGPGAWAP